MPRAETIDRFHHLVRCATTVFRAQGYRGAKMADIASAFGATEAALYRYVESKDALFDLVVRAAAGDAPALPASLPVPTPATGATLAFLRAELEGGARIPALEAALRRGAPEVGSAAELTGILEGLFDTTVRYRDGLKIVERSAADWPELASLWFGEVRAHLLDRLERYLADRSASGRLRPLAAPRVSARLIVETIAFFAMHRHQDPFPTPMDSATARRVAVEDLCHAYLASPERSQP